MNQNINCRMHYKPKKATILFVNTLEMCLLRLYAWGSLMKLFPGTAVTDHTLSWVDVYVACV